MSKKTVWYQATLYIPVPLIPFLFSVKLPFKCGRHETLAKTRQSVGKFKCDYLICDNKDTVVERRENGWIVKS